MSCKGASRVDARALSHKDIKNRMLNPTGDSIVEQIIYKKERKKCRERNESH